MIRRLLHATLAVSCLSTGCATTEWVRPGASEQQLWVDRSFCEQKAARSRFYGFNPAQALIGLAISDKVFNDCMEDLGWVDPEDGEDGATGSASAPDHNPYITGFQASLRIAQREIHATVPDVPFCSIPIHVGNGLLLLRVSQQAARFDLQPGDRILSVDGGSMNTLDDFNQALMRHKPEEVIRILVQRESAERLITVTCRDGLPERARLDAAFTAALEGRWNDCMYEMRRFEQLTLTASYSASIRQSCNESRRLTEGADPTYNDAVLVYESTRIALEEAEIARGSLAYTHGTAIANIRWLESNGFQSLADGLSPLVRRVNDAQNQSSPLR